MSKRIKSIRGLFGQTIYYSGDIKIGESWPGLFAGTQNHYDASGRYIGSSAPGVIADWIHHDEHGNYVGSSHTGLFGQKKHYSISGGYIGSTCDGFTGDITDITEGSDFFVSNDTDDFFSSEW